MTDRGDVGAACDNVGDDHDGTFDFGVLVLVDIARLEVGKDCLGLFVVSENSELIFFVVARRSQADPIFLLTRHDFSMTTLSADLPGECLVVATVVMVSFSIQWL